MSAIKAFELARLRVLREEFYQRSQQNKHYKRVKERAYDISARHAVHTQPTGSQRPLNF